MNFITNLRIKNFFSIKNEVKLDFKASNYNIENNRNRLFEINGKYYNKVISLYGANASGKTTFLKSIVVLVKVFPYIWHSCCVFYQIFQTSYFAF